MTLPPSKWQKSAPVCVAFVALKHARTVWFFSVGLGYMQHAWPGKLQLDATPAPTSHSGPDEKANGTAQSATDARLAKTRIVLLATGSWPPRSVLAGRC